MFTFITSLYKSEEYLKQWCSEASAVSEQLSHMGIAHEFLVLPNDPSTFERKLLQELDTKHFRIIERKRETLYATWNFGVQNAEGGVCSFWNVDDSRNALAIVEGLDLIEQGNRLVYFPFIYKRYIQIFGIKLLVKRTKIVPADFNEETFENEMHCGPFFMFTKELFFEVGPFDESYKIAGDFQWCIRAAQKTAFKKSNTVAGIFRNAGKSLSGRSDTQKEENTRIKNTL